MRHGLATNEAARVEQPWVLRLKLLVAVVGNDACANLGCNGEHKAIAAANGASGWRNQFVVVDCFVKLGDFALVDAMTKRCVHHHRHFGIGKFVHVRKDGLVQLFEAGRGSALGRQIRPIHHHMLRTVFGTGTVNQPVDPRRVMP